MDKYESCDDCIYSDVEESVCVQMQCIHAVYGLRERYVPKESVKKAGLQPTCNELATDYINRQAAIDAFDCTDELIVSGSANAQNVTNYINKVIGKIKALPPAQPEKRWIPCSERLPETDGEVLITVLDMEEDYVEVYKGFYQDQEWWTQWCHGCLKIKDEPCGENIVTAWMPLPEPARLDGEADEYSN